eukprot:scaffold2605_cov136-Cylindrotheca_fusiformis.AAC.4
MEDESHYTLLIAPTSAPMSKKFGSVGKRKLSDLLESSMSIWNMQHEPEDHRFGNTIRNSCL